jgi:endonuclease YncB( thermonuclease family)
VEGAACTACQNRRGALGDTQHGYAAFEFVRDELTNAQTVVIKTNQVDIYGRYIGHVFYDSRRKTIDTTFRDSPYLSQQLLDEGLARKI